MDKENKQILSIKELSRHMKMILEKDKLLQNVWVRGEISNFTHHSSGHMYFTLKDKESRIKCIMFNAHNQKLPFLPKEGTKVIANGSISLYERDGQYQLYVTQMQPDGIGSLYLAFEQLKKKLEAEGLFAQVGKRPIPRFPRAIGVITSPTGAAVKDIIITLQRRHPATPILLYPVLVQGAQAAPAIVKAIHVMNQMAEVDVLIIGRGGGSLEELWAFNEEMVARSIYHSIIPIISAVGHETDFTIADLVADLRAATPTAAAELAVVHHMDLKQQVELLRNRLSRGLTQQVEQCRTRLGRAIHSTVMLHPHRQLLQPYERLDRMKEQLLFQMDKFVNKQRQHANQLGQIVKSHNPKQKTIFAARRLAAAERQLITAVHTVVKEVKYDLISKIRHMDALSPLKVMQRGYNLVYDEQQKKLIKSIKQVQPGDLLHVKLTDGQLSCHVWSMEEKS